MSVTISDFGHFVQQRIDDCAVTAPGRTVRLSRGVRKIVFSRGGRVLNWVMGRGD
jgi:hypothetical protein